MCLLVLWWLCLEWLLAQNINLQTLLNRQGVYGVVQKVIDIGPDYKMVIVENNDKWVIWWLDKHTFKLDSKEPDDYQGRLQERVEDEVFAHNQAMSLKMWKLFNPKNSELSGFYETLSSLKPLQNTHWKIAIFETPSVWLIDADSSQAIEVKQAFGRDAILFNRINTRFKQISQSKAPVLFASFFEAVPKPCLDNFESPNSKAPDLYLILNFLKDSHYNLYWRTKEIIDKFPRILGRYKVHVLTLGDSEDGLPHAYDSTHKRLPDFYEDLKKQFHAISVEGACDKCNAPDDAKKVGNTGVDWLSFLYGLDDGRIDGYLDESTPLPLIYSPKLGLETAT
ncbi:hypothetical protein ACFOPX_00945 [Helicobacter baculiformis]|uniref:Uncharacterized protein n=1 Tax=Helicobacter baculiformis TaxID=427351 RepID=A0ABV7ZIK4_9HELI